MSQTSHVARLQRLELEARDHKSKVRFHRARLRACMDELSRLRAMCERAGIQFIGEEDKTHGQGNDRAIDIERR